MTTKVSAIKPSLTSSQLEKWFAKIEKENEPNQSSDAYLTQQLLGRFGLKNAKNVIDFLKTQAGKSVIAMISRELMKIEALNEYQIEINREEALLRQKRIALVLLAYIARQEANAENVAKNIQHQIDQKLQENKRTTPQKRSNDYALIQDTLETTINSYNQTIEALDQTLNEMEQELISIERILETLEREGTEIINHHAYVEEHLNQFNDLLVPVINLLIHPTVAPELYRKQQIGLLSSKLNELKSQHAQMKAFTPSEKEASDLVGRKINMLEEQLAFYHAQAQQPTFDAANMLQQLIEKLRIQIDTQQNLHKSHSTSKPIEHEIEGLKLQKRGFRHMMQFVRKEKILLNEHLEEVQDFEKACFIISPHQRDRFHKRGNSYALLPENMHPSHLNEHDWKQAKLNFMKLKPKMQLVGARFQELKQQELAAHQQRKEQYQEQCALIKEQIMGLQDCKKCMQNDLDLVQKQYTLFQTTPNLIPFTVRPAPSKQSSYAFMLRALERLVPDHAPAPQKEDIYRAGRVLKAAIAPEQQDEFKKLIKEVKPGELMAPERRLSWLNRITTLIPGMPMPEGKAESKFNKF